MKKKLTILLASNLDPCGGGRETWIANFLNNDEILKCYDSIVVLGSDISIPEKEVVFPPKVKVFKDKYRSKKYMPGIIYYLIFVRKKFREAYNPDDTYDVISCGSWGESVALYFSTYFYKKNIRTICWLRSIMVKELARIYPKYILNFCEKVEIHILKKYNLVIANGSDTSKYYLDKSVHNSEVANGIHVNNFEINNLACVKCQFVGRASVEKGILHLASAIRVLNNEDYYKSIPFSIIGDGPNSEDVKELEADIENLTYMGALSPKEVKNELTQANISFHLTLSKDIGGGGVSHSLLEAMASGQRIVCWDNDIFNQVIGSELFYKAKEGDIDSLVEKTKLAITECSQYSIQYAEHMKESSKSYDFSVHVEKFCNLVR